jgi:hypothetical protein
MPVDHIRYDLLAQEALRGVVRRVLADAAKNGLPGDHHFFVTFDTRAEGVRLSQRMRAQYPEEMTVVLQHQFWDLSVSDDGFEVGLSFGGVPEKLAIPFTAVKGFFDPSVQFGLQFEQGGEAAAEENANQVTPSSPEPAEGEATPLPAGLKTRRAAPAVSAVPMPANPPPAGSEQPTAPQPDKSMNRGEVVPLDRFRKK